jgi:hypothetical protein
MKPTARPLPTLSAAALSAVVAMSANAADPSSPAAYPLTERQSVSLAPNATLTYDSVNDSRCPPGMRCVAAGKVVYHFTLKTEAGSESFMLTPGDQGYTAAALGGVRIALDEAAVPPAAPANAQPATHPVTLTVSAR